MPSPDRCRRDVPGMSAAKRGSDPGGNRQYADKPLWCYLCVPGKKSLVGHYRPHRLNAAAHDHIDRAHPATKETQ